MDADGVHRPAIVVLDYHSGAVEVGGDRRPGSVGEPGDSHRCGTLLPGQHWEWKVVDCKIACRKVDRLHRELAGDRDHVADAAPASVVDRIQQRDRACGRQEVGTEGSLAVDRSPGKGHPCDTIPPERGSEGGIVDDHACIAGAEGEAQATHRRQPGRSEPVAAGGEGALGRVEEVGLGGHGLGD